MCTNYKRLGKLDMDALAGMIGKSKGVYFDQVVQLSTERMMCMKRSQECPCCGLKASFFAVEIADNKTAVNYQMNMYGIDADGDEVIFTRDHIIPRSKGGANTVANTTTMCGPCNWKKADKIVTVNVKEQVILPQNPPKTIRLEDMVTEYVYNEASICDKIVISPTLGTIRISYCDKQKLPLIKRAVEDFQSNEKTAVQIYMRGYIKIRQDSSIVISIRNKRETFKIEYQVEAELKKKSFWVKVKEWFTFKNKTGMMYA